LSPRPLAQILTRRLMLMALAVLLLNVVAVAVYYGSDRRETEDEAIAHQFERMEQSLTGTLVPAEAAVRKLYSDHPDAYAFALVDRASTVLEAVNANLIPPVATTIFADDWVTRLNTPSGPLIVAGHEFAERTDGLRMVFVMAEDPAGLLQRALLTEIYLHVGLPIVPVVLLLIGANALLIRQSLTPLAAAAVWARGLHPGRPTPPPPPERLPAEVADLVEATQRSLDRLTEALALEARHAAEAAHALRTPVAVLVARLDALPPGEMTDRLRADLAALSRTVAQVLASSRADRLEVDAGTATDLRDVAQRVVAALAPFAHAKGVDLSLDQPDTPVFARANAEGVDIALSNLIENAILHGGAGAVEITVGDGPSITVRDHGPGLPQGAGAQMFQPFWRGPRAVPGGAGLGLAIVERLQSGQGGAIEVQPHDEGGCVFVLTYKKIEK